MPYLIRGINSLLHSGREFPLDSGVVSAFAYMQLAQVSETSSFFSKAPRPGRCQHHWDTSELEFKHPLKGP